MYEVRPENSFHRVDSDTSLAGAIEKADNIARTNRRRYVVVQCKIVYVAEAAPVTELPNEPVYVQQVDRVERQKTKRMLGLLPYAGQFTFGLKPPEEPEEIDKLLGHTPADPQSLKHRTKP